MQSTLFSMLVLGSIAAVIVGGVIAFFAVRSAPEGFENENGFHALPTDKSNKQPAYSEADELEMIA